MDIEKLLKNFRCEVIGIKKHYSVLIPFVKKNNELCILYELRANTLKSQPSEISFPGGKVEKNESYKECAIRETIEELGIRAEDIEIIKKGDTFYSPFGFLVHSYIGIIKYDEYKFINKDEVQEILLVPIKKLVEQKPKLYEVDIVARPNDFPYEKVPDGKNYRWRKGKYDVYFYEYKNYTIWGLTAYFTKILIDKVKDFL